MIPLSEEPYNHAPEFMNIVVVIHGTEVVTVAKKNYEKYKDAVERMRYYAALGVNFRVCGLAAADYDYADEDFYDFIEIAPSAITELAHWQQQGYSLITPVIMEKNMLSKRSVDHDSCCFGKRLHRYSRSSISKINHV